MLEESGILELCGGALSPPLPLPFPLAPQVKCELSAINLPVIFPSCETARCCFFFIFPRGRNNKKKDPKKTCEAQQFESALQKKTPHSCRPPSHLPVVPADLLSVGPGHRSIFTTVFFTFVFSGRATEEAWWPHLVIVRSVYSWGSRETKMGVEGLLNREVCVCGVRFGGWGAGGVTL